MPSSRYPFQYVEPMSNFLLAIYARKKDLCMMWRGRYIFRECCRSQHHHISMGSPNTHFCA